MLFRDVVGRKSRQGASPRCIINQGSIHRLGAEVQGKAACNGWTFWHFEAEGKLKPIDILRDQAKRQLGLLPGALAGTM